MGLSADAGDRRSRWFTLALVGVTFVWGTTFIVVQEAVDRVPVFTFNAWRFAIAAAALALVAGRRLRELGARGVRDGALLGAALWAGYAFQTFGLTRTTAAKAAFVTGLFVVFTPLLQATVDRRRPPAAAVGGSVVALLGLGLLTLEGSLLPGLGDALVVGCALGFAVHIVGLGRWSRGRPAAALATVQLGTAAVLHAGGAVVEALIRDGAYPAVPSGGYVWGALALTALLASAAAFAIQTAAQAVLPPTRTAIILTMEPAFAWLVGWLGVPLLAAWGWTALQAETFGAREAAGALLILGAMLWSELRAAEPADVLAAPETGTAAQPPARRPRSTSSPTAGHPTNVTSDRARSS